jgi:hypothetical protein
MYMPIKSSTHNKKRTIKKKVASKHRKHTNAKKVKTTRKYSRNRRKKTRRHKRPLYRGGEGDDEEEGVMTQPTTADAPKKRGRPVGSKNKPKTGDTGMSEQEAVPKKRGRPIGSKNKPKPPQEDVVEKISAEKQQAEEPQSTSSTTRKEVPLNEMVFDEKWYEENISEPSFIILKYSDEDYERLRFGYDKKEAFIVALHSSVNRLYKYDDWREWYLDKKEYKEKYGLDLPITAGYLKDTTPDKKYEIGKVGSKLVYTKVVGKQGKRLDIVSKDGYDVINLYHGFTYQLKPGIVFKPTEGWNDLIERFNDQQHKEFRKQREEDRRYGIYHSDTDYDSNDEHDRDIVEMEMNRRERDLQEEEERWDFDSRPMRHYITWEGVKRRGYVEKGMCKEADDEPGEIIIVQEDKDVSTHIMHVELLTIPDMAEAFEQCSKRPRNVIKLVKRINDDTSLSDTEKLAKAKKMLINSITRAEVERMGLEKYSRESKSNPGNFMVGIPPGFKRPVEDIYPVKSYDDVEELRIHPQEKTTLWIYKK